MKNPFSWREKTTGQTSNNFTIIKSITIILVFVPRLKKNLFYFFTLSHTHQLSLSNAATLYSLLFGYLLEGGNPLLSPPWLSFWRQQYLALSFLLRSSQAKIYFLSLDFTLYFPFPHREDFWAKAIKFFVVLSIYKTLLLFSLRLKIHYLFNKESISSYDRNTLPL